MEQWAEDAEKAGHAIMGVKGKSVLSRNIQLPECVPIDYMHAVLEGVFKSLMKSWFDTSNHRMPFYLGRDVKTINKKAKRICPPSEFTRTIRPIDTLAYWKASELKSWMLHLALPLFKDHLPSEYLNHLALLVCAMHIHLNDQISLSDLETANSMLCTFYRLVPELYPIEMCKPNFHSLIHIDAFVKLWGPLWSYSMFGYESMNGFLKTTYHGTRQVLQQLVFTTMLKQQLRFREASKDHRGRHLLGEHTYTLGKIRTHKLSSDDKEALRELRETHDLAEHTCLQVAGRILRDSTIFHSRLHKTDGAKNNRICQFMFDGHTGVAEIDFFHHSLRTFCYAQNIPVIIFFIHGHYSIISTSQ